MQEYTYSLSHAVQVMMWWLTGGTAVFFIILIASLNEESIIADGPKKIRSKLARIDIPNNYEDLMDIWKKHPPKEPRR